MLKIRLMLVSFFSVLLIGVLLLGTTPAQAQTQPPNATPIPEGLSEDDWVQIQAGLPVSGLGYAQRAYVKVPQPERGDGFGTPVAVSGDTVVVGVLTEWFSNEIIYVFVRTAGVWKQQASFKASNAHLGNSRDPLGDGFGFSIAIDGNTMVVGAPYEDSNASGVNGNQSDNSASNAGAAYVFVRTGSTWSQQAYLKASNTSAGDFFGASVAIDGNTIVVGAPSEDSNATGINGNQSDNSSSSSGAAYIFTRSGSIWSQQAYFKASNTDVDDYFGINLAISGNTIVVGASYEDSNASGVNGNQNDNSVENAGAAYVFVRKNSLWSQQAYLKSSSVNTTESFGRVVDISNDTIAIGKGIGDTLPGGAVSIFTRAGNIWSQQAYITGTDWYFARRNQVAIDNNTLLIGTGTTVDDTDRSLSDTQVKPSGSAPPGDVYVYVRNGIVWGQQKHLTASNPDMWDMFGVAVALDGDTLVIGAPGEGSSSGGINGDQSDNSMPEAGAAYIFSAYTFPYIVSGNPTGGSPTTAASVGFTVTFSEPVTGVDASDFVVTASRSINGAAITSVSGGPTTYKVIVKTGSGSGMLQLAVRDNDSIVNANNVPLGAWGAGNGNFSVEDPYLVRPLTQTFQSQADQDGWVLESGERSGVGGSMDNTSTTLNLGDDEANRAYRTILHFNTGALPDTAVITRATLHLKRHSLVGTPPFSLPQNLRMDISNPRFGNGIALQVSDFEATPNVWLVLPDTPPVDSLYSYILNNIARTNINRIGTTQFRLRFQSGSNADHTAGYIKFYSGNALAAANRPVLVLEYCVP